MDETLWQYFCRQCGTRRDGLLDHPHGIGGYSWACPECGSHDIGSVVANEYGEREPLPEN